MPADREEPTALTRGGDYLSKEPGEIVESDIYCFFWAPPRSRGLIPSSAVARSLAWLWQCPGPRSKSKKKETFPG